LEAYPNDNTSGNQSRGNKTKHTKKLYPQGHFQFFVPEGMGVIEVFYLLQLANSNFLERRRVASRQSSGNILFLKV
jgi:hypothetical protein